LDNHILPGASLVMWPRREVGCVVAYGSGVSATMTGLPGLCTHGGGDGVRAGLAQPLPPENAAQFARHKNTLCHSPENPSDGAPETASRTAGGGMDALTATVP
jgi:hypothetical protein